MPENEVIRLRNTPPRVWTLDACCARASVVVASSTLPLLPSHNSPVNHFFVPSFFLPSFLPTPISIYKLAMAPVTLPPSFYNSFWSPDYRSGLEVLFKNLEQVSAAQSTRPTHPLSHRDVSRMKMSQHL